jgi:hypothetical protein
MFGEDMSYCCGDTDGSSIIQFQLFAAWIILVRAVNLQITRNKFGGMVDPEIATMPNWYIELSLCSRVQYYVCSGNISFADICHLNETEAKLSRDVL